MILVLGLKVDKIGCRLDETEVPDDLVDGLLTSEGLNEEVGVIDDDRIGGGGGGDLFGLESNLALSSSLMMSSLKVTFNFSPLLLPFASLDASSSILGELNIF